MIPDHIVLEVLRQSSWIDIVKCRAICQQWRALIDESNSLKYHVFLGIHGKIDGPLDCEPRSPVERLNLLHALEKSWTFLAIQNKETLTANFQDRFSLLGHDLVERIHLEWFESESRMEYGIGYHRLLSSTLLPRLDRSQQSALDVPLESERVSFDPDPSKKRWESCSTDAASGLIIYESRSYDGPLALIQFHLRSLNDPELNHPLATNPVIDTGSTLPYEPNTDLSTLRRFIFGSLLIFQVRNDDGRRCRYDPDILRGCAMTIIIWNWMTGKIVARLHRTFTERQVWRKIALLSSTAFVLPVTLAEQSGTTLSSVELEIYDFSPEAIVFEDEQPTPVLRRTFLLPAMADASIAEDPDTFDLSATSTYPFAESQSSERHNEALTPGRAKPFVSNVEDSLCAVTLQTYLVDKRQFYNYVFITFACTLLAPYPSARVHWDEWGVKGAAVFHGHAGSSGRGLKWALHGSRVAIIHARGWDSTLQVFDYSPPRLARHAAALMGKQCWPVEVDFQIPGDTTSLTPPVMEKGPEDHDSHRGAAPYHIPRPFASWPIVAGLPFLRSNLQGEEWTSFDVHLDMDQERVMVSGWTPGGNQHHILTF